MLRTALIACLLAAPLGYEFHADLDWNAVAQLSPRDAVLRLLRIPDEARRVLAQPAPASARLRLPRPLPRPARGHLTAGAAAIALDLPESVRGWPIAGTPARLDLLPDPAHDPHNRAKLLSAMRGVRDALRAKALSLVVEGKRLVWISVDTCMVPEHVVAAVEERLRDAGRAPDFLAVSATHTHSGPGGINPRPFVWLAMDPHDRRFSSHVADWCARAALAAMDAEVPARAGWGALAVDGLVVNRRDAAQAAAKTFDLLRVTRANGAPLAAVVLGPIHATMLTEANRLFSADVAGTIERALEARLGGGVALFVQGAEGDQAPLIHYGQENEEQAMERIGADLGARAAAAWNATLTESDMTLDWRAVRWYPPRPILRPGLLDPRIPRPITIPLHGLVEPDGIVSAFRVGARTILTVPGEPILELGRRLTAAAEEAGAGRTLVAGVTNGYVGYVATPEEYDKGGYEAVATLYGARTAFSLIEACREASRTR
jgi:neutral ceramidase